MVISWNRTFSIWGYSVKFLILLIVTCLPLYAESLPGSCTDSLYLELKAKPELSPTQQAYVDLHTQECREALDKREKGSKTLLVLSLVLLGVASLNLGLVLGGAYQ